MEKDMFHLSICSIGAITEYVVSCCSMEHSANVD